MQAPIAGQFIAEIVTQGRTLTIDSKPFRIDRFVGLAISEVKDIYIFARRKIVEDPMKTSSWMKYTISVVFLLIYFLGWSAKDVFTKVNLNYVDPGTATLIIALSAAISAFIFWQIANRIDRRPGDQKIWTKPVLFKAFLLSSFTALALYLSTLAIGLAGPVNYAVTEVVVYPVWIALLAFFLLKDRITKPIIIGTIIAVVGFFVFHLNDLLTDNSLQLSGILLVTIASFFFASSLTLVKDLLSAGLKPVAIVFSRFLLLGLVALPFLPKILASVPPNVTLSLTLIGVLGNTTLFIIFFYGLKNVSTTIVSVFVASSPLFTALFTWLIIPNTTFTIIEAVGLAILLFGLLYTIFKERRKAEPDIGLASQPKT